MYNIAIVDDEHDILSLLQRFLQKDFQVTIYDNPIKALNDISIKQFDLVLSDIMMPEIDGIELLKRVREQGCETKFIIMTAFDTMDRALAAHKYGAMNYIKKPFKSLAHVKQSILDELQ